MVSMLCCAVQSLEITLNRKGDELRDVAAKLQQSQEQHHASELKHSQVRADDANLAQQVSECDLR